MARIRRAGGVMSVTVDYAGLTKLVENVSRDVRSSRPAILAAHKVMATTLQQMQADEAIDAISEHGRAQRRAVKEGPLVRAIKSSRNRNTDLTGYTVGFLGDKGKFPLVGEYARGLEEGTDIHVGKQKFFGLWVLPGGRFAAPVEGALDAIGFKGARELPARNKIPPRGWVIRNPIVGYHFQRRGYDKFVEAGWTTGQAIAQYKASFEDKGLDFLARLIAAKAPAPRPRSIRATTTLEEE